MTIKRLLLLAGAALLCLAEPAHSHPHVFVTTKATVLYDKGTFIGLRETWWFDKSYSAVAVEELRKNEDGAYDLAELAELAKVNIESMREYSYFTIAKLTDQKINLGEARDYQHEYNEGVLSLQFTVPFVQPVPVGTRDFSFAIYDPEYFIAFEFANVDPVNLSKGAPASCKTGIQAQKTEGVFGITTSQAVVVACDRP